MPPGFLVECVSSHSVRAEPCSVRNVAQAHVQALLREDAGDKRFNVSLVGFTFSDAVEAINARDDPAIKKAFPKMPTGIKGDKSRKGPEVRSRTCSPTDDASSTQRAPSRCLGCSTSTSRRSCTTPRHRSQSARPRSGASRALYTSLQYRM